MPRAQKARWAHIVSGGMIVSKNIAFWAYQGVLFKSETPKHRQALRKSEARSPKTADRAKRTSTRYAGREPLCDTEEQTAVFGKNIAAKICRG